MISISTQISFSKDELKSLFDSVGWSDDMSPDTLFTAISRSSHCVVARLDGKLVGFARSMDDGIWSANIDCVVVHNDYQRQGIGNKLLCVLLDQLSCVRYVSVSPDHAEVAPFYAKHGFKLMGDGCLMQRVL